MADNFCRWHNKPLREVAEWQQEQCNAAGKSCSDCEDFVQEGKADEENSGI